MPFDPNKFKTLSTQPTGFSPEKFRALSLPDTATTTPVTPPAVTVPAPVRYDATRNPYGSLIQKHATAYGVDPHLVEAMIQHESSGNPKAVSPKGATGLMQLMPDTAREEGVRNPFDPDENIRGGAQRLAKLLKNFGTPEKALWAYNAGPDSARTRPMPDETRKYIQNVLKTYRDLDFQNQAKQPLPSIGQRQLPGRSVVAMPADLVDLFPNASPALSRGGGIVQRAAGGLVGGAAEAAATWHTPTMQPLGQRAVAPVRTIGEEMRAAGEAAIAANPPQEKYRLPESFKGYFTPEFGAKLFDPSFWATNLPEQAVIMAPFMVAVASGGIPGYVLGNVLFEAGNQFADAKAHGASDQEALLSSCVVAAANVPVSAVGIIPGTEAIKRWSAPAVARKAAAVALDWFGEGVEEGGQRWAQNLSAHLTYDPKQKLTEGVGAEAMAGLTVAGPTKAAGLALSPLRSTEGPAQPPGAPPAATPQTTPPGSPAQPEPAASQAPAVPGVQPAVQPGTLHAEVRAYQDEMRTVSPEMALVEVRPVPALTADDRDVQRIGRKLGRDVRLVQARQDGQAMQLQMPAWTAPGSGRIYVEAGNPGMALLGLFHHELQHSMEQTDAELYNAWLDRLVAEAPTLIEEARAQYAALAPALLRERLTREALTKEGAAQLAQVMTPEMVEKWQSEDPKMWERFVTKVREVLAKMGWYDEGRRAEILRNSEKAKAIRAFEDLIGAARQTAIRTKPGQVAPAPSGGRMVVTQQPAEEAEEVPDWVTEDQSEKPDVEQGLVSEDEWNRAAPPKKQRHKKHKRVKDYIGNVNLRSVQRTNKANGEVLGYYGEFTDHLSSRDPAEIEKTVRRFIRTGRINGENQGRDADSIAGFINNASEGFPQSLQNILAGGADRAVTGFDVLRALGDESLRNQPVLDEEEAVRQGEVIRYAEAFVQEKEQKIADAQEAIAETEAELEKPNLPEDQRAAMVQYVADLEEVIAGAQKERDEANEQAIDARAGKFAQRMIVDKELGATPVIPGTLPKPKVPMTAKPRGTAGLEGTLLGGKSKEELAQEADKKAGRQIPMFAQRAALRPEDRSLAEEYWKLQAKVHTAPVGERETLRKTLLEMGRQLRERGVTPQQMNRAGLDMEREGRFALREPPQREALAPTLYSALRVAADRLPNKAPAATILNALKKQPNVKSDEIDATGLADFLGDRKGITRQEVQDFLDENAVEVRVVEKGEPGDRYRQLLDKQERGDLTDDEAEEMVLLESSDQPGDEDAPQYNRGDLVLPGAVPGSYREILLTLPSAESPRARRLRDELENLVALPASETTYKGEDRQKAYDRLHAEFVRAGGTPRRPEFRSGHWSEPNVVAHLRMDERTGPAGERVLFLEEIQSDWHQKGREKGYKQPIDEARLQRLAAERDRLIMAEENADRVNQIDNEIADAQEVRYRNATSIPDAPWKDTARWTELALKHAVRYAAENGYDAVSWTTGDQQNDRYDLRKVVDEITYDPDMRRLFAYKDEKTVLVRSNVDPEDIPGIIGKELATRLRAQEVTSADRAMGRSTLRRLTGLDLEVGGSGMREYYDRIVPDVAKALARKLDKGHPGVRGIELATAIEESPVAESGETHATTPQQSIAITPAMAQTVLEQGQPMFAQRQRPDAKHAFEDADVWADHIANRGIERPTLGQKVGQAFVVAKNRITRDYEHLPKGARFSSARFQLHLLEKSKGMASELAMEKVDAITKSLDEDEYDLLGNILYLRDLRMRLRKDIPVPTPWDKDSVERELERQEKFLEDNPRVKEAIDARVQMVAAVNKEYVDSAEDIGFHVRDIIGDDPDYWHHQVMEHYGVKNIGLYGTGKRVKTPRGRGFLKTAEGTLLPHNTDYVQAEYEVVAQKIADTFQNRFFKRIDEDYNVYEEAKERARVANKQAAREIFLSIAMDTEPTAADLKKADDTNADLVEVIANRLEGRLGVRQAMGFEKLRNAVELPTPQDGSFDEVAEALRADTLSDDQMPDLFHYLAWIMKNHPDTEAGAGAAMIFKGMGMKRKAIQDMLKKAGRYSTFRDEMPEGYEEWQPDPGTVFYNAFTLPTQMVLRATEQGLKELNIPTDVIRRVLAVGGRRKSMVIPSELAETLNNMTTRSQRGALDNVAFRAMGKPWKIWSLVGPPRVIKYNLRNPSGDADHILAGNPGAFARSAQATGELWQFMISKSRTATPEIRDYYMMGGFSSTLGVQELGDLHDLEAFRKLYGRYGGWSKVPKKVWNAYWKTARVGTEYREQILRYSAYLWYLDNLNTHEGKPTNWGASIPEEVMALRDNKEKAFKLSNDLLGPYDEVSVYGKQLRDGLIPFWSWNEVNFRIYKRIVQNAYAEGRLLESMPTIAGIAVKNAGKLAVRNAVRTAIGANLMWAALAAWNRLVVPDEDDEVPTEERSRVHITFPGRGPKGEVRYFSCLGALGDLLDWFTLQSAPRHARDFLNGYKTLPRILTDMLLIAPSEKLVNALMPVGMKGVTEMLTGRKLYPSWTKPVTVRDRWEYLFDMWALKPEYRLATGKPGKPYAQRLEELVWYNAVPGEADYHELQEDVAEWNRKRLGVRSGFILTEPGRALYNLRMAWRYDNAEAIERYKREYLAFNRTTQDVQRGFEELAPLSSLPREDRLLFIESLDEAGRKRLAKALQFYTSHMLGSKGDVFFNPLPIIADRAQQIMQKENLSEQDAVRRMLTEAPGSVKPSELLDELRARKKALAERAKSQEVRQAEADKSELESDFDANQASAALLFAQYHHLIRQGRKAEAMRVMSALKDLTSQYGATSDRMFGELLRGPQDVEKFQGRYKKFFWELKTGQRELPRRKRPELPVPLPGKRPTKQPAEQSFHW